MSAAERLKALKELQDRNPHVHILNDSLKIAYPQILAVVEAAERAVPVIAQGERAMQEMVWTQRDVTARDALSESLTALEEALS